MLCETGDFFFFSSRRRHTRCSRDWSSDVCSSDLPSSGASGAIPVARPASCWRARRTRSGPSATRSSGSPRRDRKRVVEGKRGDLGGRRIIKKKKKKRLDDTCVLAALSDRNTRLLG